MKTTEPPSRSNGRALLRTGLLLLGSLPASPWGVGQVAAPSEQSAKPGWQLAWSDEFHGANGTAVDASKWSFDLGGGGYGNHELETYTDHRTNIEQRDGHLVITARKEDLTGADGFARSYTSARIKTQGRFAQAYGRFEARMQLPVGKGIWPAFWLLGEDVASAGWPRCGEIDIMEEIGDPSTVYSTLHGPGYSGGHAISAKFPLPAGETTNSGFHVYAVEWAPNDIKFFFDDRLIVERTPADLPPGAHWAYDHPFFVILNFAVGGDWPGNPDASTAFPQQMLVDYVRVYRRDSSPAVPAPR